MKINSLVAKTALAAAIAGASFAVSAKTFPLTVANPTTLANEIFGAGSNTTIVQLPEIVFDAAANSGDLTGKASVAGKTTIKLTLGGDAVFGEVYDDPANWAAQNIVITVDVGGVDVVLNDTNATVSAGGTKNDNQITITTTSAIANALNKISIKGLKVQGLKSALERQGDRNIRTLPASLEVREDATAPGSATDNAGPTTVIQSLDGIILDGTQTSYTVAGVAASDANGPTQRARINVADNQELFTDATGTGSAADFASPGAPVLNLGTLTINRNDDGAAPARPAGKEDGTLFDFTAGDTISLRLSATNTDLRPYGTFYLEDITARTAALADPCVGGPAAGYVSGTGVATAATPDVANVVFTNTSVLGKNQQLCADVRVGAPVPAQQIPEATIRAELNVDYFSARYTNSRDEYNYGRVLRNGCQITLFNVPAVDDTDSAFVRFTNTSGMTGQVNAYLIKQDGTKTPVAEILDVLNPSATAVFHTNAGVTTNGSVVNLSEIDEFAGVTAADGRSRIVLQGAFPSCEALGLVRQPNGTLTNMTATTYNDGNVPADENGVRNGTSNTGN